MSDRESVRSAGVSGDDGLALAVARATRGLRSDVAALVEALREGVLLVPLARRPSDLSLGPAQDLPDELSLVPHLLADDRGRAHCVLFTGVEAIERVAGAVGWTTDGGDFEYCTLPARAALAIASELLDEPAVEGLVLDPMSGHELMLRRDELGSIARGKALPLVGYVEGLRDGPSDDALVAELDEPPPEALTRAIEGCLAEHGGGLSYELRQTFDAERDIEPHLTLILRAPGEAVDVAALERALIAALEGRLPPPGYIDMIFEP